MGGKYHLALSEKDMRILVGVLFYFGQEIVGPAKFFEDFVADYAEVYNKDGKEHIFKTRSLFQEEINYTQIMALLLYTSELLVLQKKYNIPANINDILDCSIKENPQLRDLGQGELMNLMIKNLGLLLKRDETKD
ncbi:hypothetical protein EXW58_29260 (plasmid) [Bacillus mycoides]|uniref:hypothetical protein n=1 Tax=Bacillus mycoides TaxID=1405 RepID=UPI001C019010|nr:hypothetical protein [Bacillus mycoides]QWG31470.1 hypothetical protein EXW58_29260 [Bacillus mycoides]